MFVKLNFLILFFIFSCHLPILAMQQDLIETEELESKSCAILDKLSLLSGPEVLCGQIAISCGLGLYSGASCGFAFWSIIELLKCVDWQRSGADDNAPGVSTTIGNPFRVSGKNTMRLFTAAGTAMAIYTNKTIAEFINTYCAESDDF